MNLFEIDSSSSELDSDSTDSDGSNNGSNVNFPSNFDNCIYPLTFNQCRSKFNFDYGQYEFPDGKPIADLPKLPPEKCFWRYHDQKNNSDKYSKAYVSNIMDKRLEMIADYFKRLRMNQLTKKELKKKKPTDFYGPYFPTPKEIEILNSLVINVNWNVPKHQTSLLEKGKHSFTTKEIEYLIKRWQKFQNVYKIYDLRPILGVRCGLYNDVEGFKFFRMINNYSYLAFLQWMGKGIPDRCAKSIRRKLMCMADWFYEGKFVIKRSYEFSGFEYKCIDVLYERYGFNCASIMELLIGRRYKAKYLLQISLYAVLRHIPIKNGNWSKQEDLEIIKYLINFTNVKDLKELLSTKIKIQMFDLFNVLKTRTTGMLFGRWKKLKRELVAAINLKNKSTEKKIRLHWSHDDTVTLICKVYETKAESMRDVDWFELAKHFPGVCDVNVKTRFRFLIKTRVPRQIQRYFDDSLEYLYHNVIPVYKLKQVRQHNILSDLTYALDLCSCTDDSIGLLKYFEVDEIEDYEDDSRILTELRNENPFLESNVITNSSSSLESESTNVVTNKKPNGKRKRSNEVSQYMLGNKGNIDIKDFEGSNTDIAYNAGKKKREKK